mgnify:CR=1 FL=1
MALRCSKIALLSVFILSPGLCASTAKLAQVIRVSDGQVHTVAKVISGNVVTTEAVSTASVKTTETIITAAAFGMDSFIIAPNPFNPNIETLKIDYTLTQDSAVEIWVYAINGQEQWHSIQASSAGFNQVSWDGVNAYGEKLASGAYVVYVKAQGASESLVKRSRLLVLK